MDEAFLNDLLECSVCLEQLDGTSKVLPCQHTFCKHCLEEIVNSHKALRCPECRVLVETSIDGLPSNILLIRLLEGIKNNTQIRTPVANSPFKKAESSASSQRVVTLRASQLKIQGSRQVIPLSGEKKAVPKQVLQTSPCAKALYSYDGKEPGDLSFKKGEVIILQRQIDQNWYHGDVNGKYGFLPAKYVQVIVPLPTHIPQCKALFNFSVGENDEKDCLTFNKCEVITVIRRVDDNWAEGKLGDKIGIFPISFVEMNVAAKSLMKLSVNTQPGPSRVAPPMPTTDSSQIPTPPVTNTGIGISITTPHAQDSSITMTASPSPYYIPCTSTSSNSTPSMPLVSSLPFLMQPNVLEETPILKRSASHRSSHQKRHSLSSLTSSLSHKFTQIPLSHRHSVEIISTSGGDVLTAPYSAISGNIKSTNPFCTAILTPTSLLTDVNVMKEGISSQVARHYIHRERGNFKLPTSRTTVTVNNPAPPLTSNVNQVVPPVYYMALYNYRPQKEDELELKKGELYTVSEKCQDGWFKGTSIRYGGNGVFPGNYVHIAKTSGPQVLTHHTPSLVASVQTTNTKSLLPVASMPLQPKSPAASLSQPIISSGSLSNNTPSVVYTQLKPPPLETKTVTAGFSEWARSLATTSNAHRPTVIQGMSFPTTINAQERENKASSSILQSPIANPWICKSAPIDSAQVAATTSNSLIAQTTTMATVYPSAAIQAHHNSSNLPTTCSEGSISQPCYVNKNSSISFPLHLHTTTSYSVMTPPNVSLKAATFAAHSSYSKTDKHKVRKDKTREGLMKRLTSKRRIRSSPVENFCCDNPSFVDSTLPHTNQSPVAIIHMRSGSVSTDVAQKLNLKNDNQVEGTLAEITKAGSRVKQPNLVRERFRCVVPYPPNSEYELELKVGDVVYVHKKRDDGWFKGTLLRTGKTGLFPASFVESF